jgi:hypothetical protein
MSSARLGFEKMPQKSHNSLFCDEIILELHNYAGTLRKLRFLQPVKVWKKTIKIISLMNFDGVLRFSFAILVFGPVNQRKL